MEKLLAMFGVVPRGLTRLPGQRCTLSFSGPLNAARSASSFWGTQASGHSAGTARPAWNVHSQFFSATNWQRSHQGENGKGSGFRFGFTLPIVPLAALALTDQKHASASDRDWCCIGVGIGAAVCSMATLGALTLFGVVTSLAAAIGKDFQDALEGASRMDPFLEERYQQLFEGLEIDQLREMFMVMLNFYLNAPEDSPFNSENPEEDMRVGFEDGHFTFASEMNRDEINFYISQGIPNLEHLPQFLLPCGIQDGNRDGVVDFQDFMDSLILGSMLRELKPTDVGQSDGPTQQELCDNLLLFVHRADPQASADHVDAAALSRLLPYLADYKLLPETRDWDTAANKLVSKFGDGLVLDQPAFSSFVRSLDYTWYLLWKVEMGGPLQATLLGEYVEQNEE